MTSVTWGSGGGCASAEMKKKRRVIFTGECPLQEMGAFLCQPDLEACCLPGTWIQEIVERLTNFFWPSGCDHLFLCAPVVLSEWPGAYKEWPQSSGEGEGHKAQMMVFSALFVKKKCSRSRQIFRSTLDCRAGVTGCFHCGALFKEQCLLNRNKIVWQSGTRMSLRTSL